MTVLRAKVTSKGQVTLPKPLRDTLDIREGDQIEFAVDSTLQVSLVKLRTAGASAGILKHLAKKTPITVKDMDKAIGNAIAQKYKKLKQG